MEAADVRVGAESADDTEDLTLEKLDLLDDVADDDDLEPDPGGELSDEVDDLAEQSDEDEDVTS